MKSEVKDLFKNDNALIFIAMAMLSKEKDNVIPELLYTINREDLIKLIAVFGGENLYIPNNKEFVFYMNCAVASYYYISQEMRWPKIKEKMNLDNSELQKIKEKVKLWTKLCNKDELNLYKKMKNTARI